MKFQLSDFLLSSSMKFDRRHQPFRGVLGLVTVCLLIPFVVLTTACSPNNEQSSLETQKITSTAGDTEKPVGGMNFFEGPFEEALQEAAAEEKMLFVDVYTTWCGPCIVMQETVFPLPEVGEYFNERFINFKLDAESEEQNGPELAARYDIGVYPTYLILTSDGTELSRASSAMSGSQFVDMVSRMLGETESTFAEMEQRYEKGDRGQEFVQQYLLDVIVELSLKEQGGNDIEALNAKWAEADKYKQIAKEYFESRPYSELINETDVRLVLHFWGKSSRGDTLVEFVIDHFDDFLEVSSEAAMSQFVFNTTWYAAVDAAHRGDEIYLDYIKELQSEPLSKAVAYEKERDPASRLLPEAMGKNLRSLYLQSLGDWDSLFSDHKLRLQEAGDSATADMYSSAARAMSGSDNSEHRAFAIECGEKAFQLDRSGFMVVTDYTSALLADGKKEKALEIANEYVSGLTDSDRDLHNLETFKRITSGWYTEEAVAEVDEQSE